MTPAAAVGAAPWHGRILRLRIGFLAALLTATALLYLSGLLWRADLALYDAALPTGPAPSDVVIVAIDDASLAQLGRWPWARVIHAALLDRLREAGVRAVALDILFTEPDPHSPAGDAALAAAMRKGPPTVLPLVPDLPGPATPAGEQLPIAPLAMAAAGLGHADLEVDPDGIVRSLYLREGPGTPTREYLGAALLEYAAGPGSLPLRGERPAQAVADPNAWVRDYRLFIPFLGPPGHFTQVSYVDVLSGAVGAAQLRGKLVLVGTTAQGIGDALPTPRSGHSRSMPGVEICANILQALRAGTAIRRVPELAAMLFGLVPVALLVMGLQWLAPRHSLAAAATLWCATLAASFLALRLAGWWWPPTAALAVMLLAYPLWSWRLLSVTQSFLEEEFHKLTGERAMRGTSLLPDGLPDGLRERPDDYLQHRIGLLRQLNEQLRATRAEREDILRFLSHDMKSPASSLLGLAALQRDPARALPANDLSQRLDTVAQRMLGLVDNFVGLARAEAADPDSFHVFDLRDAAQDAYDEVWAAARAKDITLALRTCEAPCLVSGERRLLARACVNLLGNAVKFSPAGSHVELECEPRGGNALLRITDQGPGVPAEKREALFQRFARALHRGADPGGSGLGLAFVRVVAAKHGGRAWAEHDRPVGTAFLLSVPLVR